MKHIYSQFQIDGLPISYARYGSGHINETYLLVTNRPRLYILQKLNSHVFRDIPALMRNVIAVTDHLHSQGADSRHALTLVPTNEQQPYLHNADGEYWRMYDFITDSICLNQPENAIDLRQSGIAFGMFQNQLANFPAETLSECIPNFHHTIDRYRLFHEALQNDALGRAAGVQAEIDRYLSYENEAGLMVNMCAKGELPLRVTHNDTKLNNVMLDAGTHTPLCVIDLDTVMPGLVGNDFGDSIRFGASTAAEDERDLDKVQMSLDLFAAYADGFLSACGKSLTQNEIETLPMGAKLMTLECGVRFLTDYLNGDVYFHTAYSEHNLDRCRTQIKLVDDMTQKFSKMQSLIAEIMRRY